MSNSFFSLTKEVRRLHQPKKKQVMAWINSSLIKEYTNVSIQITIVSQQKSQQLNLIYRGQNKPTNVISLEYPGLSFGTPLLVGEIILCDAVIVDEALAQHKTILEHYAHMLIHGMLHLQGFDHENEKDAMIMEGLEIDIMAQFGFNNPYAEFISNK